MYKENLVDLPVRFDLGLYMEISMDLQVAWENLLQAYK